MQESRGTQLNHLGNQIKCELVEEKCKWSNNNEASCTSKLIQQNLIPSWKQGASSIFVSHLLRLQQCKCPSLVFIPITFDEPNDEISAMELMSWGNDIQQCCLQIQQGETYGFHNFIVLSSPYVAIRFRCGWWVTPITSFSWTCKLITNHFRYSRS